MIERIKQGVQYMLPSICNELWAKTGERETYDTCHVVIAALSVWGHNTRHWLQKGGMLRSPPHRCLPSVWRLRDWNWEEGGREGAE